MDFINYPLTRLEEMPMSKQTLAERIGLDNISGEYDCAIPEPWVISFAQSCNINRQLVTSTTFWVYLKGDSIGQPISGCTEVQALINQYFNKL